MANIKNIPTSLDDERLYKTSFHETTIHNSLAQICGALGIPVPEYFADDKVHFECHIEMDGIFFTIYGWKESDLVNKDTILDYHIGTATPEESDIVAKTLKEEYGLNTHTRKQREAELNKFFKRLGL